MTASFSAGKLSRLSPYNFAYGVKMGDGYFAGGLPHKIPSHRHGSSPQAAHPLGERNSVSEKER